MQRTQRLKLVRLAWCFQQKLDLRGDSFHCHWRFHCHSLTAVVVFCTVPAVLGPFGRHCCKSSRGSGTDAPLTRLTGGTAPVSGLGVLGDAFPPAYTCWWGPAILFRERVRATIYDPLNVRWETGLPAGPSGSKLGAGTGSFRSASGL